MSQGGLNWEESRLSEIREGSDTGEFSRAFHGSGNFLRVGLDQVTRPDARGLKTSRTDPNREVSNTLLTRPDPPHRDCGSLLTRPAGGVMTRYP